MSERGHPARVCMTLENMRSYSSYSAGIHRHKRGYLPHCDSPELIQFVTFRLAESLPATFFKDLEYRLRSKQITEIEYHRQIEKALDLCSGPTYLKDPSIAEMVANALLKFQGVKYELIAWVIMPNHVHILFRVLPCYTLSKVIHSIKSYTAVEANKILGRTGRFWSADYFDRYMRDRVHLAATKKYINENPVKAGLCSAAEDWPWGSTGWSG